MLQFLCFRTDLAVKYGVNEAIFLHQIVYWTQRNQAENRHCHQGRYWTYHTRRGLAQLYPIWSDAQIKRIVSKLRKAGALLVGNFNEDPMLRTNWYAPSDDVLAFYEADAAPIGQNRPMHCPDSQQTLGENGQCMYKDNKEATPKNTPVVPKAMYSLCADYAGEDAPLLDAILGLLENRAAMRKSVKTARAMNGILNKLDKLSGGDRDLKLALLDKATVANWLTVFPLRADEMPASAVYNEEGEDGI
ncbi:hypothetical protein AALC17_05285 [Oscillospiraceae bacterium 38-13]